METEELVELQDLLLDLRDYFIKRDEMNALMHLAEPRYSPLTERVSRAAANILPKVIKALDDGK